MCISYAPPKLSCFYHNTIRSPGPVGLRLTLLQKSSELGAGQLELLQSWLCLHTPPPALGLGPPLSPLSPGNLTLILPSSGVKGVRHLLATWDCGAGPVNHRPGKTQGWAQGQSLCPQILGSQAPGEILGFPQGPRCRAWAPGNSQHPSHLWNGRNEHAQGWRQETAGCCLQTSFPQVLPRHWAGCPVLPQTVISPCLSGGGPQDSSPHMAQGSGLAELVRLRHQKCCVFCIALHCISIGKLILCMKAQKN